MSKFSDFMQAQEKAQEKISGIIIDGAFGCQQCFECVDEAEYFQRERLLKWECQHGHVSYIEDFLL